MQLLLEQATRAAEQRCPIARASLAVTLILYDHFEVDKSDGMALDSRTNFDQIFRPLLLQWSRLHTAGLQAFLRLWKSTGARTDDFDKVEDLVRILVEHVVGQAPRTRDVREVEEELAETDHVRLRELQMELLEMDYENAWGHHLRYLLLCSCFCFLSLRRGKHITAPTPLLRPSSHANIIPFIIRPG